MLSKSRLKKHRLLFCSLLASCLPISSQAATERLQSFMQMELTELLDVEVFSASLFPEPIMTAPGSVTVITAEQIQERGYRHLGELLSDLPGVDVNHYADAIALDMLSFRGIAGNNKILILQDGIRVNSPSGDPIPVSNNFPLYHLKQVEVINGPGSALYGADAFSGVINLITKDFQGQNNGEILLEGGDFDYANGYFNVQQRLGDKAGLQIGGHIHKSDNPDLDHYYSDDLPDNGLGGFEQPTSSHSLNMIVNWDKYLKLGYTRSYMRNPTSAGAHTSFVDYSADADYRTLIQTAYAKLNYDVNSDLKFELNLNYSDYEVEPESEFVNLFTDLQHLGYKYAEGSRAEIEPRFIWTVGKQRVVAGVSAAKLKAKPKTANLPRPYDGDAQYYPNTNNSLPIEIFNVDEHNIGGYLQFTSYWDSQWTTTLGARYDSHSTYGDSFTPRASVTYAQSKNTSWELSYAESFLAPSPFHRYENYGSFAGDFDSDGVYESWFMHVPNSDLDAEELKAIEISVNHRPTPWLSVGAVLYHQKVKGIITATESPVIQSDFVPGGEIFFTTQSQNVGELESTGLELTSSYTSQMFGAEAKFWGSIAIVDGELDEFGSTKDLPYTTNAKFKGGVTLKWNEKYTLTTRMHWLGPTNGGVDTEGVDASSHAVVYLHGQIKNVFVKGLDVQLSINNLFDSRYYESGDGSSGGGSGLDQVPQDPRWVKLALKYRF